MLSLLYGPTLPSIHDYWKNHSFDYNDLCQQSDFSDIGRLFLFEMCIIPSRWLSDPYSTQKTTFVTFSSSLTAFLNFQSDRFFQIQRSNTPLPIITPFLEVIIISLPDKPVMFIHFKIFWLPSTNILTSSPFFSMNRYMKHLDSWYCL